MDDTTNISEAFDIPSVIQGLASDLRDLRAGKITPKEAQVRAELAKQIFNGLRIVVSAQKYFSDRAKPVRSIEGKADT